MGKQWIDTQVSSTGYNGHFIISDHQNVAIAVSHWLNIGNASESMLHEYFKIVIVSISDMRRVGYFTDTFR